jgi:ketosteroid isomerase-like protein
MRVPTFVAASLLAVSLTACSAPQVREFGEPEVGALKGMLQEFVTTYNAKDATGVAGFFDSTAVVMPPNASTVRGVAPIEQYYVARFNEGASDLSLEPKDISGSGTLAYISGDYRLNMAPPEGPQRRDRGKFLFVLREVRGSWKLEYLMFSSDFPPVAPEASPTN